MRLILLCDKQQNVYCQLITDRRKRMFAENQLQAHWLKEEADKFEARWKTARDCVIQQVRQKLRKRQPVSSSVAFASQGEQVHVLRITSLIFLDGHRSHQCDYH